MSGKGGGQYLARQFLSASSGTYTPTTGTRTILLHMCGAGGGGGGAGGGGAGSAAFGAGGNSGFYIEIYLNAGGATFPAGTFTTGASGAAGSLSGGGGGTGGDSTFVINSVTYTAKGGTGGAGQVAGTTYHRDGGDRVRHGQHGRWTRYGRARRRRLSPHGWWRRIRRQRRKLTRRSWRYARRRHRRYGRLRWQRGRAMRRRRWWCVDDDGDGALPRAGRWASSGPTNTTDLLDRRAATCGNLETP